MEYISIKKANGETRVQLYGSSNPVRISKGEQKKKLLGENVVEITFDSVYPVDFYIGDRITVYGEDYFLNLMPTVKKTADDRFEYSLTFESAQYELSKVVFLDEDKSGRSTSGTFSLRANLEEVVGIIINNLVRVHGSGTWSIGKTPSQTTDVRDFSFSDNNCLAVLQLVCDEYGTEFEVVKSGSSHIINIGTLGQIIPYTFRYGRGKGLYTLNRQNVSSSNIVTRLYAYGSTKSLPLNYRNYASRLRLGVNAESYIEDAKAIEAFGILEGSKTFDEVYPHRVGTVTAIYADDILSFSDSSMFDLNATNADGSTKYLVAGVSAKITFNSGGLKGYTFEIESYNHETKTFKLLSYTDPRSFEFPSPTAPTYQIGVGNEYVITDVYPRQEDIDKAEAELLEKATEYLKLNCAPRVQYEAVISEDYLANIAGSSQMVVNIFNLGDAIGIIDEDVNISRTGEEAIRIVEFTRSLIGKTPYSYKLSISDTVEMTIIERMISDQKQIDTIIKINDLTDASRMQRSWRTTQELLSMIFDQEGYFKDGNIKPNSIETQMLSVGAKAQQMILRDVVIEPNYGGDPSRVYVSGGQIIHYGLFDEPRSWNITTRETTLSGTSAFYIYVRCTKEGSTADIIFDTAQKSVEDGNYYYFILGALHSTDTKTNTRWISLTYGATAINGRFIKTGRISSADGSTWFDLDNSEIHGKITFGSDNTTLEELNEKTDNANDYITNTLPGILGEIYDQLDGVVEIWFGETVPTLTNYPANTWPTAADKESHLGDLYYDNNTGIGYRFSKSGSAYQWIEVRDSGVTEALAAAQKAQDTADGKRRVFTSTPYPPYDVGDLWTNGIDLKRCTKARVSGSYVASDWDLATNYTGDESLNSFINGVFANTVSDILNQVDGKIEMYYQTSNPWNSWPSSEEYKHIGDLWYNTSTKELKRYTGPAGQNIWSLIEDAKAIAAAEAASKAQDTADGKRRVFVSTPTTPYDPGDLWTNGTFLKRCITRRASGSYVASDWGDATNYDNTKTIIDGGIVTSGTVQLAGSSGSILAGITGQGTASTSVRIWAGATYDSRASAPFRVLQSGEAFSRYRIELQDSSLNGLAGICGQGTDGTDSGVRFWAGSTYANRVSAPYRVLKDGSIYASKATLANGCKIGEWSVSNNGIFNDSGEAYIIARKSFGNSTYCEARIGANVFPSSSGIRGAAYFEHTESNSYGNNFAAYFYAANARNSYAIYAKGVAYFNEALIAGRRNTDLGSIANVQFTVDPSRYDVIAAYPYNVSSKDVWILFSSTKENTLVNGKEITIINRNDDYSNFFLYNIVRGVQKHKIVGGCVCTIIYFGGYWYVKAQYDNNY